ncbi:MAG: type II secretion system major pseudopilin GspG [Sneathiella sp.]
MIFRSKRIGGNRRDSGFTLLELLVALAILALLTTLVAPKVIGYLGSSKTKAAKIQLSNIEAGLDLYKLDNGNYPSTLEDLITNSKNLPAWTGPYLKSRQGITDPWGQTYLYKNSGENGDFDLSSLGADNQKGGDGENQDISNK